MRNRGKAFLIDARASLRQHAACRRPDFQFGRFPILPTKCGRADGSLAEARVQLALGNPGLALEAFRKVLRTEGDSAARSPASPASYAAMGRYDLARSNYEAALALAPHDPALVARLGTHARTAREECRSSRGARRSEALDYAANSAITFDSSARPVPANIAGEGRARCRTSSHAIERILRPSSGTGLHSCLSDCTLLLASPRRLLSSSRRRGRSSMFGPRTSPPPPGSSSVRLGVGQALRSVRVVVCAPVRLTSFCRAWNGFRWARSRL